MLLDNTGNIIIEDQQPNIDEKEPENLESNRKITHTEKNLVELLIMDLNYF